MGAIRITSVVGTRPEAIKIAPLVLAAARRPWIEHRIVATGQQREPFDDALTAFGLTADDRLAVTVPSCPDEYLARLVAALLPRLAVARPDMLIVQGDTSTAYAAARAATILSIPVAHVEAGLRSGDLANPWPEERNRVAIDRMSALLFAPTHEAAGKLESEGVAGKIEITGNTGIDALLWMRERVPVPTPRLPWRILLTCHRRESFGRGIEGICAAALRLADRGDVAILCPVHSNPAVAVPVRARLGGHPAITLAAGLGYRDWVATMASARLILSDSGGIQEEAPALGVPVLVLRDVTERPEGIATGNLRLVGTDPDRIVAEAARLLDDPAAHARMARPAFPFGRGDAADHILDGIEAHLAAPGDPALRLRRA